MVSYWAFVAVIADQPFWAIAPKIVIGDDQILLNLNPHRT